MIFRWSELIWILGALWQQQKTKKNEYYNPIFIGIFSFHIISFIIITSELLSLCFDLLLAKRYIWKNRTQQKKNNKKLIISQLTLNRERKQDNSASFYILHLTYLLRILLVSRINKLDLKEVCFKTELQRSCSFFSIDLIRFCVAFKFNLFLSVI
jgi:hypothetical protein